MWLKGLYRRIRALFRSEAIHREIDEEMRFHIEMRAEESVRAGMPPEEARREAERRFGRLTRTKEEGYEVRGGRWLETLWRDFRYGARSLRRSPGFTLVAVVTLALGIGANTAIFSLVNAVLLRQLPFPASDELIVVKDENGKTDETFPSVSPADFFDWKSQSRSFEGFAAYSGWPITLLEADRPEVVPAERVTDEFFKTLRVQPLLGRVFRPEEFKDGGNVMILSHRLWQRRFGGDPGIVGKTLAVEQSRVTVVGVMPPDFKLPATAEAWVPVAQDSGEMRLRASRYFQAVARLKPGVTREQAEAEMRTIAARLEAQYPDSNAHWSVRLTSLRETLVGDVRPALLILFGAVSLVLLIACGNVSHLLLARATTRQRELMIRSALGASRWRIIRQLITESLLLSLIGGVLGVVLAQWCVGAIVWLVPKDLRFPRIEEARVDLAVLGFTFAVSLLISVILGVLTGLRTSRPDLSESLKEGARGATADGRRRRLRGALVVGEIALTMMLLVGAGLLIRSLVKLQRVELGFNPERLVVVPVSASMAKYAQPQARATYFERLAAQVSAAPGVRSVAKASSPPLMYTMYFPFAVEGRANPNEVPQAWFSAVSPNYFREMGIGVLEGREFTDHDRDGAATLAVISETMRRRYFAGEDPVGKRLTISYLNTPLAVEVVGVVKDIKQESLGAQANAQVYVSDLQLPWFSTALLIRTESEPSAVIPSVERAIRSADPTQSGSGAKTMEQLLYDSAALPRFYSLLLGVFASLALLLAAVGIYGVISYAVVQRTHEIGVRMALGAQARDVLKLVVGEGMLFVSTGLLIGLVSAFALTRVMKGLLYEVSATDPTTFAGVAALLTMVALMACLIPARRATKVDPLVALRHE
jgi:putative ABC transport system permease protein